MLKQLSAKLRTAGPNHRDKRIVQAAISSIVAKGGGLVMQLVAIPIVVRTLGVEGFGVFSLVSSVLGFIAFAQFGIGGHLTQQIAHRLSTRDFEGIRKLTWTALALVSLVALVFCSLLGLVCQLWGLEWLWGSAYIQNEEVLKWGFYCVLVIGCGTLVGNTLSGCQAGYQELHIGSLYAGAGNSFAAIGLVVAAYGLVPDLRQFWVVLYGLPLLVLIFNIIHLLYRHQELRWRTGAVDLRLVGSLFKVGGGFMVVQTVLPLIQRDGSRIALAHQGDIVQVAHLSAFLQVSTIVGGLLAMFTTPIYGAIADAAARNDRIWIVTRLYQVRWLGLILGTGTSLTSYFFGPWILKMWLGSGVLFDGLECLYYALYFSVTALVHVNHVFLLAQGYLKNAVMACLPELIVLPVFLIFFCPAVAASTLIGMAIIQGLTSLPLTSLALKPTN